MLVSLTPSSKRSDIATRTTTKRCARSATSGGALATARSTSRASAARPATAGMPTSTDDVARARRAREPPADDPLRMDADQRRRERDRLAAPADLDPARAPLVVAADVVDDDRHPPAAPHVAELLRQLELVAADVDRVPRRVVDPCDGDDVRRSVAPDGREPPELAPADHVRQLGLCEHAHT